MPALSFQPGSVVKNRSRLWRVDAHIGDVLVATSIDGGEAEQQRFYLDYILDTFPIVRRKDEQRYGEYRTKRLILEVYESLRGWEALKH